MYTLGNIKISPCTIKDSQFKRILSASCRSGNILNLDGLKILTDKELNLTNVLKGCNFSTILFGDSGNKRYSDWETYPHRLENLIKAFSESEDFKKKKIM